MSIRWEPEFTVWDDELDRHHQQLIRNIQVLDEPKVRDQVDATFLRTVVDGLVEYSRFHFAAEEERMRQAGYPALEAHRREHEDFAKDALLFREAFGKGSQRFERILLRYLKDWLTTHILTSDKQMGAWLKEQREGQG